VEVIIKPPCDRCGQPYLHGSETTCRGCLRRAKDPNGRHHRLRLRCDCGKVAVVVILVKIRVGGLASLEPLAVCKNCLKIEMEMMREYL
jgi:hypothetical protein